MANVSTPRAALAAKLAGTGANVTVKYAAGVSVVTGDGAWGFDDAIDAARDADLAVLFLGSSSKGNFVSPRWGCESWGGWSS